MNEAPEVIALSVGDAAARVGVSRSTLFNEINAGLLKRRRVGRRTVVAMTDLQKWLDSKADEVAA